MKLLYLLVFLLLGLCAVPANSDSQIRLVSQNLNRLFDDKDDGNKEQVSSRKHYNARLDQVTKAIKERFGLPDILALQEVESIAVLRDLATLLRTRYGVNYRPVLIEGNDPSGIDVGYLILSTLELRQFKAIYAHKKISKHNALFSRPPLFIEACSTSCVSIINVHLRSMRGLGNNKKGRKVAKKRKLQAEALARWINIRQSNFVDEKLFVVGDFNALMPSDRYVDVVGTILGKPDQNTPKFASQDLIRRDLVDITARLGRKQRVSYVYHKRPQQLDYLLASQPAQTLVTSIRFGEIDYSLSDHAALIAEIKLP